MHINQNILIAGSDGYIGQNTYKYLSQKYQVSTVGFYDKSQNSSFSGDLIDRVFVEAVVKKCPAPDVLVFLVGLAHRKGKGAEVNLFERVNYLTLVNLLNGLEKANKLPSKIIFSSTISVYGERKDIYYYDENIPLKPFSPYALTKQKAENFLNEKYPERSWVLRFAPVYSSDFFLNIERRVKIGLLLYRVGSGKALLSLCNLKNILNAIGGIIEDKVPSGIYNISDRTDYSYNDILQAMNGSGELHIPVILVKLAHFLGKISGNQFLKENSLKLMKDNIFPSEKIRQYIDLPYGINDI